MCNHYRNLPEALPLIPDWREYVESLKLPQATGQDVWPGRAAIIAHGHGYGGRGASFALWGMGITVAGKRPGTRVKKRVTNIRNLDSGFWRPMLNDHTARCLVPFTRFAEPRPGHGRDEIWFRVTDREIAAFAGISRPVDRGAGADATREFAFLTCEPNAMIAPVHPRAMPVILHPDDYEPWLAGADAARFATPFPSQLMAMEMEEPEQNH